MKKRVSRSPAFDSRIAGYACAILVACYGLILTSLWTHGYTLFGYKNLTDHDFSMLWAAGRLASVRRAAAAYDPTAIGALLRAVFGEKSVIRVTMFFYPPWFLIVLAPVGSLPFATAAAIWLAMALAVYLMAMRAILSGGATLIAALAFPPVLLNLLAGQNGLLSAGLLGGALVMLNASPIGAGVLIGLLAYKPQYGVLLPLFLAITGRWRVFASAAATIAALAGVAAELFGADAFAALARALPTAGDAFMNGQVINGQYIRQNGASLASVYGLLRGIGLDNEAALYGHIVTPAAAAAAALCIAVSGARADLKAATVATGAVIVTPYSEYYDVAILAVPIAFLVRDGLLEGFRRSEWAALTVAFLMPLLYIASPVVTQLGYDCLTFLVGPLMCAILAAGIGRRLLADPGWRTRHRDAADGEPRPQGYQG